MNTEDLKIVEKLFLKLKEVDPEDVNVETFLTNNGFEHIEAEKHAKKYADKLLNEGLAEAVTMKFYTIIRINSNGRDHDTVQEFLSDKENKNPKTVYQNISGNTITNSNISQSESSGKNLSKNNFTTQYETTPKKSIKNSAIAIFIGIVIMIIGTYIMLQLGWIPSA